MDILKSRFSTWFFILLISLGSSVPLYALQNTQPRYAVGVESILHSHEFIQKNPALTYWKLSPYYLPQLTESSCSLASGTMIINAARSDQLFDASQLLATQADVLMNINSWEKYVETGGDGLTLDQLGEFMSLALKIYGLKNFKIQVIHTSDTSQKTALKLHQTLIENEKSGRSFMIANFNQKFFTGNEDVGHFAPVGAYDIKKGRVLLMDPDRTQYEPYWVPEKLFLEGMATRDSTDQKFRGYLIISWEPVLP